jgi:hypothetical protein
LVPVGATVIFVSARGWDGILLKSGVTSAPSAAASSRHSVDSSHSATTDDVTSDDATDSDLVSDEANERSFEESEESGSGSGSGSESEERASESENSSQGVFSKGHALSAAEVLKLRSHALRAADVSSDGVVSDPPHPNGKRDEAKHFQRAHTLVEKLTRADKHKLNLNLSAGLAEPNARNKKKEDDMSDALPSADPAVSFHRMYKFSVPKDAMFFYFFACFYFGCLRH